MQKNKDKEFTVSADKLKNKQQYYVRKGFVYYVMRWTPMLVIAVVIGLLIAHFRGYPVREKILEPALLKMGVTIPEEADAQKDADAGGSGAVPNEPPSTKLEISDEN